MHVALPECDGRVISVPISFKEKHRYVPDAERLQRVADFARRLAVLRSKSNSEKRIAIVLSNAGGKAQRIGGAVGLDTPASLLRWLMNMRAAGYEVGAVVDACASGTPHHEIGIERLRAAGVTVTTVKGVYYDWIRDVASLARVRAQMGGSLPPGLTL